MDTQRALLGRRTIHKYQPGPIPEEVVEAALQAALMAPNHKLTQPLRVVRVGPLTRDRIVEVAARIKALETGEAPGPDQLARLRASYQEPAELFAFARVHNEDAFRAREDYAAVACAIQNLSLSLFDAGFGAKWSTGKITRHSSTYEILGLDPDAVEIVGFVWAGVPAPGEIKAPPRLGLAEVVTRLP